MMTAWRVTRSVFLAALLIGCSGVVQAQELKVGDRFHGSVHLTKDSGGVILPLPDGEWQLVGLERSRHVQDGINLPTMSGALVLLDLSQQQQLKSFITFHIAASDMFSGGWKVPATCSDNNMLFRERKEARSRREIRCWGLKSYGIGVSQYTARWYIDMHDWIVKNTKNVPVLVIGAHFVRASGPKFLSVLYFFNPESVGQSRVGWTNDVVQADPKKLEYIESLKDFSARLELRVEAGFAGKAP